MPYFSGFAQITFNGIKQYLADAMSYVASMIGHIIDSVRAPDWSADAIKCLRFKTLLCPLSSGTCSIYYLTATNR